MLRAFWKQTLKDGILHRIEIHDAEFSGTAFEIEHAKGWGFDFEHQEITSSSSDGYLSPFANRIQRGVLDFYPRVDTPSMESLFNDILGAENTRFKLVWLQDGDEWWTGYIDTKQRRWKERKNFFLHIRATDTDILKNYYVTFEGTIDGFLISGRETQMEAIARMLGVANYGMGITSATSWIVEFLNANDDYLNQTYIDIFALRIYARTGDETDEPITAYKALQYLSHGLIIRQMENKWHVEQLTSYENPSSVRKFEYNPIGVQQSSAVVDRSQVLNTSVDNGIVVVNHSENEGYPAIKTINVKYDHRTKVSGIKFPESFRLTPADLSRDFSQLIISDGSQQISISGTVKAQTDDTITDYEQWALYTLKAGTYYWNATSRIWSTSFASNKIELTDTTLTGSKLGWQGFLSETTTDLPADADGTLTAELFIARNDTDGVADYSDFIDFNLSVLNALADENSTYIDYSLTQTKAYDVELNLDDMWYGDGPTSYSRSAITRNQNGTGLTTDSWARRGETVYLPYAHIVMREIMDTQRGFARKLNAIVRNGVYNPAKISIYNGSNYFHAGGSFSGGEWNPLLMKIDIKSDV